MKYAIVPTDFSPRSFNALIAAKQISKKTKSPILLLHVVEEPPLWLNLTEEWEGQDDERANRQVNALKE